MIENYRQDWDEPAPGPQHCIFENPFSDSGCHNSIKMALTSSLMVSCQTPSRPQRRGIRSLGKCSTGAPWDSSRNSCGWCWLPLQARRCLRLLKAIPPGKAELSSLKGMAPSPMCQEEAQVAPTLGRAVGGLGVLPVLAGVGTRDGSPWRRRQLHVHALAHTHTHICFQPNIFGGCFIWAVSSGLLPSPEDDGWAKESCGTGKWTAWLLMCAVWGFIAAASPAGWRTNLTCIIAKHAA